MTEFERECDVSTHDERTTLRDDENTEGTDVASVALSMFESDLEDEGKALGVARIAGSAEIRGGMDGRHVATLDSPVALVNEAKGRLFYTRTVDSRWRFGYLPTQMRNDSVGCCSRVTRGEQCCRRINCGQVIRQRWRIQKLMG